MQGVELKQLLREEKLLLEHLQRAKLYRLHTCDTRPNDDAIQTTLLTIANQFIDTRKTAMKRSDKHGESRNAANAVTNVNPALMLTPPHLICR